MSSRTERPNRLPIVSCVADLATVRSFRFRMMRSSSCVLSLSPENTCVIKVSSIRVNLRIAFMRSSFFSSNCTNRISAILSFQKKSTFLRLYFIIILSILQVSKKHPSHGCEGCFGEIFLLRLSGVLGDILGGIIGDVVKVLIADIHVQRRLLEEDVVHQGHNVQGHQGKLWNLDRYLP